MKKGLFLLLILFLITGCKNINKSSYEDLIASGLYENDKISFKNKTSQGYSYYLPKGLIVVEDLNNNLTLKSEKYNMYLYVDIISYYHKIKDIYKENSKSFYSKKIENGDKFGYLEINLMENDKYLIEIMYNYAKIEVIVNNKDINEMLSYAISLLGSISYNDEIIANMVGDDILNYNENEYNIFDTVGKDTITNYDESEQNYTIDVPDTDLIK